MQTSNTAVAAPGEPAGRVVIGTVTGDLHDIGENLVASMLGGSGFGVIELGANVPRVSRRC
jgi:methanogenic corrinoid protein MtbC1